MPQETYSLLDLDEDVDEDRTSTAHYAPYENMLSAAQLVISCLATTAKEPTSKPDSTGNDRYYAIQGGFPMQLRGGRRSTRDIDLITNIKMRGVWEAITGVERIIMPDSRLVEGVIKVFVKTGKPWDACAESHSIELDIKQAGFRGSPRNLEDHIETVGPFDFFGQSLHFNILDVISMMRIKIECCLTREEPRDFDDVKFMITHHAPEIRRALATDFLDREDLNEVLEHAKIGGDLDRNQLAELVLLKAEGQ